MFKNYLLYLVYQISKFILFIIYIAKKLKKEIYYLISKIYRGDVMNYELRR